MAAGAPPDLRGYSHESLVQLKEMIEGEQHRRMRATARGECDICGAKDHAATTMERQLYASVKKPAREAV